MLPGRGTSGRRAASGVISLCNAFLLAFLLASWWSSRTDTLFGTGRWLAGKDTGKYVFYTYDFLFRPLGGGVDLTSDMGFQEILLREAEGPGRLLERVGAWVWVEKGAYLWTELHREGQRCLAFRISRREGYPGGWTRFGPDGKIEGSGPWDAAAPRVGDGWHLLDARLEGRSWLVTLDGVALGRFRDQGPRNGSLGFRGSGPIAGRVLLRDVSSGWADPVSGRRWTENDRLVSEWFPRRGWGGALAVALGFLALRRLARSALLAEARPECRRSATLTGEAVLGFLLGTAMLLPGHRSGAVIPGVVVASALADWAILGWAGGKVRGGWGRREPFLPDLVIGLVWLLVLTGLLRHGRSLLRADLTGPPMLRGVHPALYRTSPPDEGTSLEFVLEAPATVEPGKVLFAETSLYEEQVIEAEVDLPPGGALDLVFQSRSFGTAGDPLGELLPYGRRLLRFSADPRVPGGLSRMTGARPAPFRHLAAKPAPGPATIRVAVEGRGVTATVNGTTTEFPGVSSLGRGETGLMAWGGPVAVRSLHVRPREGAGEAWVGRSLGLLVLAGLLVIGLVSIRMRWESDAGSPVTLLVGVAALPPPALYLLGVLFLSGGGMAFLEKDRAVWLSLLLLASFLAAAGAVLLLRGRLRRPALPFNLLLVPALAAAAVTGWHLLPENHALRLRFTRETVAPAANGRESARRERPWYADMTSVGASTFIWRQLLGGEEISREKAPGEVRVFVVGGSQAWGSGAASSRETFAELLEERLRARGLPVRVWNAGVNGAGTRQVATTYLGLLRDFRPDIVVADLGLNDATALFRAKDRPERIREMAASLDELAGACRADGTDVLLLREPMSLESPLRPVEELDSALAEVVLRAGFGVADPRPLMAREEARGMVWWDTAHLTPRGQHLMADFIEEPLARLAARRVSGDGTEGAR